MAVLREAAETLTPCTMELSGCDAVFILRGAKLQRAADCLAHGMRLNGGATCIAPRRVYLPADLLPRLESLLLPRVAAMPAGRHPEALRRRMAPLLEEARSSGARLSGSEPPLLIADAPPTLRLLAEDLFAPVLTLIAADDEAEALSRAATCPYALGAAIFGPQRQAQALALKVKAGSVSINDLIVPTADARLPFGGRNRSGFGVTRGAEGLLDMTVCKTITTRTVPVYPHLIPRMNDNPRALAALINVTHGGFRGAMCLLRHPKRTGGQP